MLIIKKFSSVFLLYVSIRRKSKYNMNIRWLSSMFDLSTITSELTSNPSKSNKFQSLLAYYHWHACWSLSPEKVLVDVNRVVKRSNISWGYVNPKFMTVCISVMRVIHDHSIVQCHRDKCCLTSKLHKKCLGSDKWGEIVFAFLLFMFAHQARALIAPSWHTLLWCGSYPWYVWHW